MPGGDGALDQYWAYLKENYRKNYSEIAADHMVFPRNTAELIEHNGFGIVNDAEGHTLAIWLLVKDGVVEKAAFTAEECPACTASGSMVTELAIGKAAKEALKITAKDVMDNLGGLPAADEHCARLAADTMRMALEDYLSTLG